jgi:hypothetical protein
MEPQGFRDLVGRVMTDPDFFADLVRAPEAILAEFTLSADERSTVLQAVGRAGQAPTPERLRTVKAVMMKRWAM